jgi:hypothetical protein
MTTIAIDKDGTAAPQYEQVPSVSIDYLLHQRDALIRLFRAAVDALTEASALAAVAHLTFPAGCIARDVRGHGTRMAGDFSHPEEAIELFRSHIDASAWRYLMDESGMKSLMSAKKREAFEAQLRNHDSPMPNRETIYDTFSALHASRAEMFEQGVIECCRRLSWRDQTNTGGGPMQFGKRIIVTYLTAHHSPNHHSTSELDDLMRVFHVFDGKPEADHRNGCYRVLSQAMAVNTDWPKLAENDYIAVRLFRNGNGHVRFKRPDLIAHMNRIVAKHFPHGLPAP